MHIATTNDPTPKFAVVFAPNSQPDANQPITHPLSIEMLDLFEQITGWVVEFNESPASYKNRQLPSFTPQTASGNYYIDDMSAAWPAERPTSHRAKCDRLVELISELAAELQQTQIELTQARSVIAAFDPAAPHDEDVVLIDSFIPKYEHGRDPDRRISNRRADDRQFRASDVQYEIDVNATTRAATSSAPLDFNQSVDLDELIKLSQSVD